MPAFSTIVAGVITGVFYTVVSLLSESTLLDTIAALGIMICWYYGITAFACVWYFRRELFANAAQFRVQVPVPARWAASFWRPCS